MTQLESIPVICETSVGLEDFRAVYDVFQCVCFKPNHRRRPCVEGDREQSKEQRRRLEKEEERDEDLTKPTEDVGRKRKHSDAVSSYSQSSVASSEEVEAEVVRGVGYHWRGILDTIREIYCSASPNDQKSWNVENDGKSHHACTELSPSEFLSAKTRPKRTNDKYGKGNKRNSHEDITSNYNGYCSFVLQDDSNGAVMKFSEAMQNLLVESGLTTTDLSTRNAFPHSLLLTGVSKKNAPENGNGRTKISSPISMAPHYWIFVGQNHNSCGSPRGEWLPGRKEHTDDIDHDGTVHHQLLGGKLWKLRPTQDLRDRCDRDHDVTLLDNYEILVEEGDVFVINTKLWWHHTEIPPGWSVSYARDLYLDDRRESRIACEGVISEESSIIHNCSSNDNESTDQKAFDMDASRESVSNVEVSWASGFIPKGTTLVIDEVAASGGNTEANDDDIASLYHHLVPPTIGRTRLESKANCKLVVLPPESVPERDGFGSGIGMEDPQRNPTLQQVALEAIRDIREGDVFVMLYKKK